MRSLWKAALTLGLVNIPVVLDPATTADAAARLVRRR